MTKPIRLLGVVVNRAKPRAPHALQRLEAKAAALGIELVADRETAARFSRCAEAPLPALFDGVDAIMAMGGDGTMLRTVRELDGRDKPVIGVNLGSLGFLTSVAEEDLDRALECLAAGRYTVATTAIAECGVFHGEHKLGEWRGLNDVVVSCGSSSRVITLDVSVDGDPVTSYVCDGLIVSTPAGSTGHSLSAGGPILMPATQAFVISLICPHTLSSRPLVVPDRSSITVTVQRSSGDIRLSVDGQVGQPLAQGDSVRVRRGERNVGFIHLPGHSYFSVLRHKLHWSGSNL